jgi:hypothetical protein
MPPLDDNQSSAEATLRKLFKRLTHTEDSYRNVHRIELFTIRRFLETGRKIPSDVSDPKSIIDQVIRGAEQRHLSDEYVAGVEKEANFILKLLATK